jgi:hypothetical protein
MTYVDAVRDCRASVGELRASMRRFSDTVLEIEQVLALFRDAVELLYEGEPVRALAQIREAAAVMGCATLH